MHIIHRFIVNMNVSFTTVVIGVMIVISHQVHTQQQQQQQQRSSREQSTVLTRVKRRGSSGGHSYGTRVSMPVPSSGGGKQIDPLQLALGAKALVLKVLIIKQLMSTTTQMPVITNVNTTGIAGTGTAAGGAAGGAAGRLRKAPGSGIRRDVKSRM